MKLLLTFFTTLFVSSYALANFTYEGTLVDPTGNPVTGSVIFTLKIKSPTPSACLLYTETHTIAMTNSDGYFSLVVGSGNGVGNTYDLNRIFQNRGTLNGLTCGSGSTYYSASAGDARMMEVTVNPNGSGNVVLGSLLLNAVPQADSSRSVSGFEAQHLLRAVDGSGEPAVGLTLNPGQLTELSALISGASTNYVTKNATSGSSAQSFSGSPSSPVPGTFWYDSTLNKMRYYNGSIAVDMGSTGGTVTSVSAGPGLIGGNITSAGTLSVNVGTGPNQIPQLDGSSKLPLTTLPTGVSANQIPQLDSSGKLLPSVIPTGTAANMIPKLDYMGKLEMSTIPDIFTDSMWTMSAGNRYVSSGYVGIGTASPAAALDVQSGAGVVASFGAPSQTSAGIAFRNTMTTSPLPFLGLQNRDLTYRRDGGTEAFRVSYTGENFLAGKLGLNNSTPQYVMDVTAEGVSDGGARFQRFYSDASGMKVLLTKARGTPASPSSVMINDSLMDIIARGYDGTQMTTAAQITAMVESSPSASSVPGALLFATANSGSMGERMRITSMGNVGIGTTAPGYKLEVAGAVAGSGSFVSSSDRRYKKNIAPLNDALAKVLKLRGVSFDWKLEEYPEKNFSPAHDMGFIAQEIEAVYPEAVVTDAKGYKSVAYSKLVSPLVESTKAIYAMCASQEEKVATMQRGLASVEEENRNLKAKNEAMQVENQVIKAYLCAKDPSAPFCK